MGKQYVFSTLSTDMDYVEWKPGADKGALGSQGRTIRIKGGAGVANDRIVTPLGVSTEVDDEDVALLEQNEVFKLHKANGHVTIQKKKADAEKVAADMNRNDPSSPKTPADYANAGENDAKPAAKNQ